MTEVPWKQRAALKRTPKPDPITDEVRRLVTTRSKGRCELCGEQGQHLHHRQLRRAGDHSAANIVHVCGLCHRRIHGHVAWATEHGWLVSQYAAPYLVPILKDGALCLLRMDGTVAVARGPASA